jgi:hypothetical protein
MHDKHQIIEEPCEAKVSRTVLKTSGTGDSLAEFNEDDKELCEWITDCSRLNEADIEGLIEALTAQIRGKVYASRSV